MTGARKLLALALVALAVLYGLWFRGDKHLAAALLVFALPPLLLLPFVLRNSTRAAFWAGVLALAWFSHAVMAAWSRPVEAAYAGPAIALSLLVVFASSWDGLRKRFGGRGRKR